LAANKKLFIPMDRLGVRNFQDDPMNSIRAINSILNQQSLSLEVKWLTNSIKLFTESFPEGHFYQPGGFLIDYHDDKVSEFQEKKINYEIVNSTAGEVICPIKIAMYSGKGTAEFCLEPLIEVLNLSGFEYKTLSDNDIRKDLINEFDVLLVPGGPDAGESYYSGLGDKGYTNIKNYVYNRGHYLGLCAGAYLALKPLSTKNRYWLALVDATDDCELDYWRTGTGFVRVKILENESPIVAGLVAGGINTIDLIYWEGPAMKALSGNVKVIAEYSELIASGSQDKYPKWDLQDNLLAIKSVNEWYNILTDNRFEKNLNKRIAILEAPFYNNKVILISPHAEFGNIGIAKRKNTQSFQIITNALFYLSIFNSR